MLQLSVEITASHITWMLTLLTVLMMGVGPLAFLSAWLKFMDIMRRLKDGKPW